MQKKRARQILALLLAAAMGVSALSGWQQKTPEAEAAIYEGPDMVLREPLIKEDTAMRAGQKATYDLN